MRVFAFDHRSQMVDMDGATPVKIGRFKELCLDSALQVQHGPPGHGILCDGRLGRAALFRAEGQGLWIGRPVELPGSRPLEPEIGPDCGGLVEWPRGQVVKCLCFSHPDDDATMWEAQIAVLRWLLAAMRRNGLEFLLEVILPKVGPVIDETCPAEIRRIYDAGIFPTGGNWSRSGPKALGAAPSRPSSAMIRGPAA